jgi:hypothetical protein
MLARTMAPLLASHTAFYATSAGVIPLLLFALLFQLRLFDSSGEPEPADPNVAITVAVILSLLGFSELLCLARLWAGDSDPIDAGIVQAAMGYSFLLLIAIPVRGFIRRDVWPIVPRWIPWVVENLWQLPLVVILVLAVFTSVALSFVLRFLLLAAMVIIGLVGLLARENERRQKRPVVTSPTATAAPSDPSGTSDSAPDS